MNDREALEKIVEITETIIRVDGLKKEMDSALTQEIFHIQKTAKQAVSQPQEKTFTLDEVREVVEDYFGKERKGFMNLHIFKRDLLQEFGRRLK